jgi:hypothetical protein
VVDVLVQYENYFEQGFQYRIMLQQGTINFYHTYIVKSKVYFIHLSTFFDRRWLEINLCISFAILYMIYFGIIYYPAHPKLVNYCYMCLYMFQVQNLSQNKNTFLLPNVIEWVKKMHVIRNQLSCIVNK